MEIHEMKEGTLFRKYTLGLILDIGDESRLEPVFKEAEMEGRRWLTRRGRKADGVIFTVRAPRAVHAAIQAHVTEMTTPSGRWSRMFPEDAVAFAVSLLDENGNPA